PGYDSILQPARRDSFAGSRCPPPCLCRRTFPEGDLLQRFAAPCQRHVFPIEGSQYSLNDVRQPATAHEGEIMLMISMANGGRDFEMEPPESTRNSSLVL